MKTEIHRELTAALAAIIFVLPSAAATFDDVQFWAGSGANRAALVLDWNDGKSPESIVWGYRWDGTATGLDMLRTVANADPRLFVHASEPGMFGVSVYGIGYDANGDGVFAVFPPVEFDSGGWSLGVPDDMRLAVGTADHWSEGWNLGFWGYNLKNSATDSWSSAMTGPSGRMLNDGAWDGYSFAPEFNFTDPSEPVPAPVPEPGSAVLIATGGLAVMWSKRRRMVKPINRAGPDQSASSMHCDEVADTSRPNFCRLKAGPYVHSRTPHP